MRPLSALATLLVLGTGLCTLTGTQSRGVNGGVNCATCTVVVGLTEQLSEIYNESITHSLERLCSYLPDSFQKPCRAFADFIGPTLIKIVTEKDTPDTACHALGFCHKEPNQPLCRVFPPPKGKFADRVAVSRSKVSRDMLETLRDPSICKLPGIKEICQWLDRIFDTHEPAVDLDLDGHSVMETLRGTSWRGKDCDDNLATFYPGTRPVDADVDKDSNCNGIYGKDKSGRAYEDLLCQNTQPRGVAVLGDSISAHFHLPEEWFDSQKLSVDVFKNLAFIVENEIDWPELSTITGYTNNSWTNVVHGNMSSIYHYLWQRNRCNHRDYQNIAANGARSGNLINFMQSLKRNQQKDYPMLVFYALVGNDVCNGHPDTFAHMTTPEQMRENAMTTLTFLDKVLPNNSYVILSGLADGRVLYDSLHDRIHPIGRLHNDVTYSTFYDYFNCLQVSPCTGWMNSNETVRNMTTAKAQELSAVLEEIASSHATAFSHFSLRYFDCPINQVMQEWKANGGQTWQLLEPVDGFHSNQIGQAMTAQVMWRNLQQLLPESIGPVNPNNAQIEQLFGDQGGY